MSKQIYEEALADVRKVTEVAEDKAKRAILEAVVPRIRALIERDMMSVDGELDDDDLVSPMSGPGDEVAGAISPPDEEGKLTLDLDAMSDCHDDPEPVGRPMFGSERPGSEEYELSLESLEALDRVIATSGIRGQKDLELQVFQLGETINRFKGAGSLIRETKTFGQQITQMISQLEDMYDYVQESVTDSKSKGRYESKLESHYKELSALQEQTMSRKKLIDLLKEEDDSQVGAMEVDDVDDMEGAEGTELTLKLTGLPDDIDLDGVGVDLISGDDDMGDEDLDTDMGDMSMGGEDQDGAGEDMDLGDLGDDLGDEEEEGTQMEVSRLSDNTIVEIDENMLRKEISRMRRLSEVSDESPGDANGYGVDADVLDDFGGADEECEAFLDGEVTTGGAEPLGESDMAEEDDMEEMDELQNRRSADDRGEAATMHSPSESVERRLAFEQRLRSRAKRRGTQLRKEARSTKSKSRLSTLKKEYMAVTKRFNESVSRTKKFQKQLVEAKKLQRGSRSNSNPNQLAGTAEKTLRKKLVAENLLNVKLTYANKVLQSESMTKRQKAQAIEKLDEARTPREAKLVYESVTGNRRPLKEGRTQSVMGSSSRATRPASTQTLNEGFETDRWSRLAGITK